MMYYMHQIYDVLYAENLLCILGTKFMMYFMHQIYDVFYALN